MLHKQLVEQTMENAAVRFAVMDIALKTGSRIDFGWREEHSIMVDSVLFLIYGVTWCVGVTMPIVIFCIYRTFLRWGWVLFMEKIPRLKRILFQITSKEYLLIGPMKVTNFFQGLQSCRQRWRRWPNGCRIAGSSKICQQKPHIKAFIKTYIKIICVKTRQQVEGLDQMVTMYLSHSLPNNQPKNQGRKTCSDKKCFHWK